MRLIRWCQKHEIKPGSKEYPILQLERFQKDEKADGIAKEAPVALVGAAVLQVDFTTRDGKPGPRKWIRFKIFEEGSTDWPGLILCARTLDRPKLGGLGFQVKDESYGFSAMPEAELPRLEAHFARKREGGVLDVLKQAKGVSDAIRRVAGEHRGGSPGASRDVSEEEGESELVSSTRIMSFFRSVRRGFGRGKKALHLL